MSTADGETPGQGPCEQAAQPLRVDAERNRERILDAARKTFAAQGIDVPMSAVARAAGVGVATLFRRFPTREDLINAVFSATMDAYLEASEIALADPDAWHGFTGYLQTVCAMQAADRGFADVLTMTFPAATHLEDQRARAYHGFVDIVDRARATGRLRPDFAPQDLVILLMANAGVLAAAGKAGPESGRRLVGYMIQAFTAPQPATLPPPPDPDTLSQAMLGLDCPASDPAE